MWAFRRKPKKSREEVQREVRALGWWYQHFELPCGIMTGNGKEPAYRPEERWNLFKPYVPADVTGKTVLDLGGNAGYFSIQMKLRGARRCVLVDPYEEFVRQAEFAASQFGVRLEIVNQDAHIYCLTTEERFDYVLFLGLFYHLKYPVLVLDRVAEMTKERLFLHSHLVGRGSEACVEKTEYERGADDPLIEQPGFPRLMFIENLYNGDPTNWWIPNPGALEPLVRSAGMKVVARPHPALIVAEPEHYFGKVVYDKLVFPRFGKRGRAVHPGRQKVDPALWDRLLKSLDD
jgi:tRNA (mo5U34)-methyltransferase